MENKAKSLNNIKVDRLIKYIIIFLVVSLISIYTLKQKLEAEDIVKISTSTAITFAILDLYCPYIVIKK